MRACLWRAHRRCAPHHTITRGRRQPRCAAARGVGHTDLPLDGIAAARGAHGRSLGREPKRVACEHMGSDLGLGGHTRGQGTAAVPDTVFRAVLPLDPAPSHARVLFIETQYGQARRLDRRAVHVEYRVKPHNSGDAPETMGKESP